MPALADEARALSERLGRGVTIPAAQAAAVAAPSSGPARSAPRVGTVAPAAAVPPVDLVRGPYLQEVTPTSAVVRWGSDAAALGRVRYGTAPGSLDGLAEETEARTAHQVALRDLPAGTRIYYALVTTAEAAPGAPDGSFLTAPPPGGDKPTRIWVVGDSGAATAAARDVRDAYRDFSTARPADLWLMLGDNAYSKGTDEQHQAAVFDTYPEELRTLPLWPTLGNHDAFSADSETGSGVYYDLFTLPREGEAGGVPSGTEAYYSFDYGTIHFLCLNSHDVDRSLGAAEPACVPQTLCVSGALPGRTEVMVRIAGPKPNGFLWPSVARLSTSRIEIWIEQAATGTMRYYLLPGAHPGVDELPGLFDRHGFQPAAAGSRSGG